MFANILRLHRALLTFQARERLTTYRSKLSVVIKWKVYDEDGSAKEHEEIRDCGLLPIMARVSRIRLMTEVIVLMLVCPM